MRLQVYSEPCQRRHYASTMSCATVFSLGALTALLLVPFYMAYNPYTFWTRTDTYLEQPHITYTYKLMVLLEGTSGYLSTPFQAYFSSVAQINSLHQKDLRVPFVQSQSVDANMDGITDRIMLNLQMPVRPAEKVLSVKVLLFFDAMLQDRAKLKMDALAFVAASSGLPGRGLVVDGDVTLRQTWPLSVYGGYKQPYEGSPLMDPTTAVSSGQTLFSEILSSYAARNVSLNFNSRYALWEVGQAPSGGASVAAASGSASTGGLTGVFNVTATFRVNQQNVLYTPPVSEVLRTGWGQYAVMFVVVWFVLDRLCSFVYQNQILETRVVYPTMGVPLSSSKLQ